MLPLLLACACSSLDAAPGGPLALRLVSLVVVSLIVWQRFIPQGEFPFVSLSLSLSLPGKSLSRKFNFATKLSDVITIELLFYIFFLSFPSLGSKNISILFFFFLSVDSIYEQY